MTTKLVAKQIQPGLRQQTLQPQVGQVLGTWPVYRPLTPAINTLPSLTPTIVTTTTWSMDPRGACYMTATCRMAGTGRGSHWTCPTLPPPTCIVEPIFQSGWMVRKTNIHSANSIIYVVNSLLINIKGSELKRTNFLEFHFAFSPHQKSNLLHFVWRVPWYIVSNSNVFIINDDYLSLFHNKSLRL